MKTKLLLYLILLLGLNSYSQIINVSTGIDSSENSLATGTTDPFWQIVSSPYPSAVSAKATNSFPGAWEATPVSGTNAKWINTSGAFSDYAGVYTFERDLNVPIGTSNLNSDFSLAFDDQFISLELVKPDSSTIPLIVVPTTSYHLSIPITYSTTSPMVGTWKIRVVMSITSNGNPLSNIGGFLLSGTISLNCQTLYVDADNDGYDNGSIIDCSGTIPTGYSLTTLGTDCDDTNSTIGSSFVLPTSLQTGLLAQYTFNGGSINDFSGNGHHLTNTTAATDATDRNGNVKCAFEFDNLPNSNNQFLSTTNTAFLNGLTEYSISCWYKAKDPTRGIVDYEVLVGRDYTPFACPDRVGQWALALYDCRFAVFARENSAWQSGGVCNEVEVWHHLTATYNQVGNTLKLYKNGVLQDTETGIANCGTIGVAPALDLGDLFLGKDFTGVLDDVFIHNREITASEVTQLYGLGSSCCSVTNPCTTLVTPNFTPITPVCTLTTVSPLPTTSLNGITGTWSPAFNNVTPLFTITTTTYTFTPDAGQCATSTTMDIQVYPLQDILFIPIDPICSGDTLIPPPNTSLNGIPGTWSPAFNNTTTTTYTFTPDNGYCAVPRTLTIIVNVVNPTFNAVAPICSGDIIAPLPTTSLNAITGTWSPAVNNTTTTTYTFTPDAGQCASTATMTIVVNSIVVPTFTPVILDCSASSVAGLPTTSLNAITGSWSPAFNYTTTTTYTFTPNSGQCATTATMTVTVSPNNPCAREIRTDGIDNNCNGFVDEIVTELSASLCGANLTSINQLIVARAVSIPGSTICGYRFLVTKWVGGVPSTNPADIQIITRPSTSFNLTQLPNYAYNTTYSVQVSVCVNGVWQPYGSNCCTVRANRVTKVQASQCGSTLTSMNEVIQADIVNFIAVATYSAPIVKPWRFEITQTSPGVGFGITQPLYYNQTRTFQMSDFPGATYGTTYSVRVAFLNDDLTWSPFGAACTITTPSIPTTQVIASQCNTVVASASTLVYADLVTGATNYRFRLSASPSFTRVWTNPASGAIGRFFTLNDFSPTGLTAGSLYNIEVCVSMDGGITYGAYGPSCTISTSGAFRPSEIERETSTTDEFSAVVYPNPTIDSFLLEIISESTEPIEIKVYDMIGRQIENRTISFDEVSSTYIGTNYPTGVYNIIITQGVHLKMVKVIKR